MSKLCMGKPIRFTRTDIIPIEMVSVGNVAVKQGCWMYGFKKPVAIIVCDTNGARVLDIQEEQWSLTEFISRVPGLESALAQLATVRK